MFRGDQGEGARQCDVDGSPFWIEAGAFANGGNVPRKLRQARGDTDGRPVVVIVKVDREPPTVTIDLDLWLALMDIVADSFDLDDRVREARWRASELLARERSGGLTRYTEGAEE